jgi:hypothetical protein
VVVERIFEDGAAAVAAAAVSDPTKRRLFLSAAEFNK